MFNYRDGGILSELWVGSLGGPNSCVTIDPNLSGSYGIVAKEPQKKGTDDKWISVKDRLPDKDGEYLVCCECEIGDFTNRYIDLVQFDVTYNCWYYTDNEYDHILYNVTHWMSLPELPKLVERR